MINNKRSGTTESEVATSLYGYTEAFLSDFECDLFFSSCPNNNEIYVKLNNHKIESTETSSELISEA